MCWCVFTRFHHAFINHSSQHQSGSAFQGSRIQNEGLSEPIPFILKAVCFAADHLTIRFPQRGCLSRNKANMKCTHRRGNRIRDKQRHRNSCSKARDTNGKRKGRCTQFTVFFIWKSFFFFIQDTVMDSIKHEEIAYSQAVWGDIVWFQWVQILWFRKIDARSERSSGRHHIDPSTSFYSRSSVAMIRDPAPLNVAKCRNCWKHPVREKQWINMVMGLTSLAWCNDIDEYEILNGGVSVLDKYAFYMRLQNKDVARIWML